jgi:5-methyltetrahydropteroyltriglutamate--homocysteine methyltransferase
VNEEALDLEKAGADYVQLDEPWVRNNPEAARRYAVKAINRALQGLKVPTIVHICFGYGLVVPGESKPHDYAFLPELVDTTAETISIESAQPKLNLEVLKQLAGKKIMLGVLDLHTVEVETPAEVAARIRTGLKYVSPENLIPAPDCGMKYLPRDVAFGKLRAMVEGARIVRQEMS